MSEKELLEIYNKLAKLRAYLGEEKDLLVDHILGDISIDKINAAKPGAGRKLLRKAGFSTHRKQLIHRINHAYEAMRRKQ